jgi:stage II sporulation protein D
MLTKKFTILEVNICFLLLSSWVLHTGCDQQELEASEQYQRGGGGDDERVSGESGAQPEIRVFLFRVDQTRVEGSGANWSIWDAGGVRHLARLKKGQNLLVRRRGGIWLLEDKRGVAILPNGSVTGKSLEIRPAEGGLLSVGRDAQQSFRGRLRLLGDEQDSFVVINIVDMEEYLEGVVGAEMPSYWYKAALRSQAVACRTYAIYQMHRRREGRWDVSNTQASQVYGGVAAEHPRVSEALSDTRGVVLTYGREKQEKIFPAYYSSNCGGHTADASAVFGEKLPPLQGNNCPYCEKVAKAQHYRWSAVTIDKEDLSRRLLVRYPVLAVLEKIEEIKITGRSEHGRVEKVKLIGRSGRSYEMDAESFRLGLSSKDKPLLSSWYELADTGGGWRFEDGRGWGHGVGMCQCGSQQMARLGKDCVTILQHYYPESVLVRAY